MSEPKPTPGAPRPDVLTLQVGGRTAILTFRWTGRHVECEVKAPWSVAVTVERGSEVSPIVRFSGRAAREAIQAAARKRDREATDRRRASPSVLGGGEHHDPRATRAAVPVLPGSTAPLSFPILR